MPDTAALQRTTTQALQPLLKFKYNPPRFLVYSGELSLMQLQTSVTQRPGTNGAYLQRSTAVSRSPVVSSRTASRASHIAQAGAGGFGKSTKKKVDTSGGLVVPKEGKRVRSSDLLDEAEPSSKQAVEGAPAGFPKGWFTSLGNRPCYSWLKAMMKEVNSSSTVLRIQLYLQQLNVYQLDWEGWTKAQMSYFVCSVSWESYMAVLVWVTLQHNVQLAVWPSNLSQVHWSFVTACPKCNATLPCSLQQHIMLCFFALAADWIDLKLKVNDIPIGKNTKPVELATGRTLMLYKFENMVFISDANSTAYQFPMTDAKVYREGSSIAAEVPLDGTVYDLATGAVLKWCPKDNPMRSLLGTLKSVEKSTPLKVYPVHITKDGNIWTKLI